MRPQDEADIVACIPSLRRYARGLAADRDRADDLVQDTLERVWARHSMWQKRGELRAWMFGIMHNHFVDGLRAQRSRPEDAAGDELPERPDRATQTDRLEVRDLDRVLQQLPPDQREVLLLVGVEELSYQDVASVIGVPIGTVMSRLSRARERLRTELQGRSTAALAARNKIQRVK
jgi:RNA polymerase sigma-70 factor (ECF subfamily)